MKTTDFPFFENNSRKKEISLIQSDIDYWQNKTAKLQQQANQFNLELGKIPKSIEKPLAISRFIKN
jgi:hypothetical protein